jgi:hypothetical protein
MQGFYFNHYIHTENGDSVLDTVSGQKIIVLNDSDLIENCQVVGTTCFQSDCVEIEFENGLFFICTFFVNLFSVEKQNFVKAHSLIKGDKIQALNDILIVKKLNYLYDQKMINVKFEKLPSFYINSVLCHSHEEPSTYALHKKETLNQKTFLIDDVHQVFNPNNEQNKNLNILWKSEKFNKWRKAFYLLDGDFNVNSSGYSFDNQNLLEIQITKSSILSDKLIFFGFGADVFCQSVTTSNIKKYESSGKFLILIENFVADSLVFNFRSSSPSILTNCLFISNHELIQVSEIFKG